MPGRLFAVSSMAQRAEWTGRGGAPDQAARRNIRPGETLPVLTQTGWREMRWGVIPVGRVNARGRPVMETIVNARSETIFEKSAFADMRRGVIVVDGWYEWTGARRRKTAWQIASANGAPLIFAAIWDVWQAPGGHELAQVATLTCTPNAEVAPVHDRMGVLLQPGNVEAWLWGDEAAAKALCRPWPDGRLAVEEVVGVDWNGA